MEPKVNKNIGRRVDLTGQVRGLLTIVSPTGGSRKGSRLWTCICACGNTYVTTAACLSKEKGTGSCGCRHHRSGAGSNTWSGCGDISGSWWSRHVNNAYDLKKRGLECTITVQQGWELFLEQGRRCRYTGELLGFGKRNEPCSASLDRIDNSKGYRMGNVQWVLKEINMMKKTHTETDFIDLCRKVAAHCG